MKYTIENDPTRLRHGNEYEFCKINHKNDTVKCDKTHKLITIFDAGVHYTESVLP